MFWPSLPGWSVGFFRGSAALPSLRGQECSSPGCPCSVPSGCLCSAPFLPSSPVPPVSLRPGGCSFPWVYFSTTCVLASSSGAGFPGVVCSVVCLQSHSHLRCRSSVFLLRPRLVCRLSPSVVFLSSLHDEVTLVWVECRLWVLPLDRNEGLVCWSRLYSFGMGSPFGSSMFCLHS